MSYKFGYPYILEFDFDYIAQVLLSALRAATTYSASLSLSLGGTIVRVNHFVPRPEAVKLSHDGQKGVRLVVTFRAATGTVTPAVDRFEMSASLEGAIVPGRKLHLGAFGGGTLKALNAGGSEVAAGPLSRTDMQKLGLNAKAEMDIRIDTDEILMDFTVAEIGGRASGIVVGLHGPKASAPKTAHAPGTDHPPLPSRDPRAFANYPGHLSSKAAFGTGVDQHMLEIGLDYVASYVARDNLANFGVTISIDSIATRVTSINWPISYNASSVVAGTVTKGNLFVPKGPQRIRLNGVGLPRLVSVGATGGPNMNALRLDSTLLDFQQFDESRQTWGGRNTAIKGWQAWVKVTLAEFPAHDQPNDIEPVALTSLTGPKNFMFAEGSGNAPEWLGPDGTIVPPNPGTITLRKGETKRLDIRNARAPSAGIRVPFVVFAAEAPAGVTLGRLPTSVKAGTSGALTVSFNGSGYHKQDLILYTNDGIFRFPLEVYAEDGKYATANIVNVVAKNFRDYTLAGGSIGSDRGIARFDAVWVSGPPVDITVSRPNPVSEFRLIGPTAFRLSSSNRQQTFTVHYDAGMRRPWQPLLEEDILFTTPAPPTVKRIRIIGSITRPHIYIPDILMPVIARAYEHGQIKDAILQMERFMKTLEEGPDIPLPPGPGPRPLPPHATDWAVVRAPALPAGNPFAFVAVSGETLTAGIDRENVGAAGMINVRANLEGTFQVGEAADPEAWLDILFEFWSVRDWSRSELEEPVTGLAFDGKNLIVASGNRVIEQTISRRGTPVWSAETELEWPVDGMWPTGRGLLVQSENGWRLTPVGVGEGLETSHIRPADFRIEAAASVSFTRMIATGDGRAHLLGIGGEIEPIATADLHFQATSALVVAPNVAVLIGPEGCAVGRIHDDDFIVETFHHDPVPRLESLARALLLVGEDGTGRMMDLWAERPRVVAEVNLEGLAADIGIATSASQARSEAGMIAVADPHEHRLEIREAVRRRPRVELFDDEMAAF